MGVDIDYDESEFAFADFRNSIYKSYINISIGCDKHCTYCIVPHTRGDEISYLLTLSTKKLKKLLKKVLKRFFARTKCQ